MGPCCLLKIHWVRRGTALTIVDLLCLDSQEGLGQRNRGLTVAQIRLDRLALISHVDGHHRLQLRLLPFKQSPVVNPAHTHMHIHTNTSTFVLGHYDVNCFRQF